MIDLLTYSNWSKEIIKLIEDMKTTPQSSIHHAEGDVYLHTQMVLDQVMKYYGSYSEIDKKILELTAIFHDIAKPMTTIFEDGDWRSPGHAKLGEKVTREILNDLDYNTREVVCALIRFHGLPIWFDNKPNPEMDVIKASLRCNLNMLSYFAECDFKGRICNDLDDSLFKIELFREKAQELNCFDKPYEFTSDWARLHYFKNGGYPGKEIYEPKGGTLVLMVGLPGSGKNTWIKNNWTGKVIELDKIRKELKIKPTDSGGQGYVANFAKDQMRECLRKKENVLWNATNITEQQRSALIDIALLYDAKIEIVFINTDLKTILSQNKSREEVVPENVIMKLYKKIEIPTLIECHKLTIV